ncbi:holin [Enterococcus florum]|uniref:Holin n=1 Tax=Enterococcus florum TaxID=2480627 RepID=A0A4P5PAA9_9ENTE|nr:phage holin family protein [Enterococcus florum]GCF95035.1 holin [Enterococcus florum]
MDKLFTIETLTFSVLGGILLQLLGGMDTILHGLIFLTVFDYFTGLAKAWKRKEINSRIGSHGLIKKAMIYLVIALSVETEKVLGNMVPLRETIIMFYLANEGISLLENISEFIPLPDHFREVFQQMRKK